MEKEIKLTSSELELIQIERKKEELKLKETKIKENQETEKKIESCKKEIANAITNGALQVKHTKEFFKDFGDEFEIETQQLNRTMNGSVYNYSDSNYVKVFKEEYNIPNAIIKHKNSKIFIKVEPHHTSSRGSWNTTNVGHRMFIQGMSYKIEQKAYKRASTVEKKILEFISEATETAYKDKLKAKLLNETNFGKLYPNATIKDKTLWSGGYEKNSTRYNTYHQQFAGKHITLINGVQLDVFAGWDYGKEKAVLKYMNIVYPKPTSPKGGTCFEVIEQLNSLEFNYNK